MSAELDRVLAFAGRYCPWSPSCVRQEKPCAHDDPNPRRIEVMIDAEIYCPRADVRAVQEITPAEPQRGEA